MPVHFIPVQHVAMPAPGVRRTAHGTAIYVETLAEPEPKHVLTDETRGKSWEYDTAAQLRTAAKLYRIQHRGHIVRATTDGK
ncbi:hypothetical protein [Aeromicrobium sp. HA]|uniref:hypothetical protein n=1 Tax=Aeromicrobium sp. HA TaxID=3009077 RepID=UPI0022AFBA86|nr:hypothetical protein [Aeromicrobium sp. HA]